MTMPVDLSQEAFEESGQIFARIAELQDELHATRALSAKLVIKNEIKALIAKRRAVLGMRD